MNKQKIKELYQLYGFEIEKDSTYDENVLLAFSYSRGYFNNIEIVKIGDCSDKEIEDCKAKYEELGYSVSVTEGQNQKVEDIHRKLFSGFFNIKASQKGISKKYENYCVQQSKKLLVSEYKYLHCDYIVIDNFEASNVVDLIYEKLIDTSSHLIILEAAAGYGKTCTSFEVFKRFSENDHLIPLMTELSRNRKAQIFKYVLLDEIDNSFPTKLSTQLVEKEIKNGLVPLIIDGFDELLSKSIDGETQQQESFEEVQNMLDTIADLLKNESKAKILLTSRKSAIFTGEVFDEWMQKHDLGAKVLRIELGIPKVKNWLDSEKISILQGKGINLDYLSSPILLSLLKEKSVEDLQNNSINSIIDDYFTTILTREQERQNLCLNSDEQLEIMSKLAFYFADLGITAEKSDFIYEIIVEIVGNNLKEYMSRYQKASAFHADWVVPHEDEFIMKLVHNALLDRKKAGNNEIGFINDFVFGYLLGREIIAGTKPETKMDFRYIDLMCTAFQSDDMEGKEWIEDFVKNAIQAYSVVQQLWISDKLYHKVMHSYVGQTIMDVSFSKGFTFSPNLVFKECIFQNCLFDQCVFFDESFDQVHFYNCKFFDPNLDSVRGSDKKLVFLGCSGHEEMSKKYSMNMVNDEAEEINYEKILLEQFWKPGSLSPERHRAFSTVYRGIPQKNAANIDKALKKLMRDGILTKLSACYELNHSKMSEIRRILGREGM